MPKKPSRPIGHIVFPKVGQPSVEREVLPTDKDQLEEVLARKFVDSLRVRFRRDLAMPVRGDRWLDFLSQEGERKVWLELVEVVNPELGGRAYRESVPVSVEYARGL